MRPAWQSRNRLDEDEEVIIKRPESDTTAKFLSAEEPTADQEMKNDYSEFEVQPDANEHAKEDTEKQNEESTVEREVQNLPVVPVTSVEESNQDDSMNHEVVLAPHEPIRTSGTFEETIGREIEDTEPAPPPITAEELIGGSPKESESRESVGDMVVNNESINDDPVSEELKDKPEAMETSGENP